VRYLVLLFAVGLLFYPAPALEGARRGLEVWALVLLPALFPASVAAHLLLHLGLLQTVGRLLEPLMRPLFRLPGHAGLALAMAASSGYLMGAILAGELRRSGLMTRGEAERFLALGSLANPLFLGGAVAVGMFGNPALPGLLLLAHYLAALAVGLLLRFHRYPGEEETRVPSPPSSRSGGPLPARAFGALLREAVESGTAALIMAGGVIVTFSSFLGVLAASGLEGWLSALLAWGLRALGFHPQGGEALTRGLFEVTLGAQAAGALPLPLVERVTLVSLMAGWGGLSVLAQAVALLEGTDVRVGLYALARMLHGFLAAVLTLFLFRPEKHLAAWIQLPAAPAEGPWNGVPWVLALPLALLAGSGLFRLVQRGGRP